MNHENSVLTRVAITMAPRLNNALFASLFQQCGGISGFFEETDQNIETLFRENNLTNIQPERSRWLQMAKQELDVMEKHHIRVCGIEDSDSKNIAIVGTRKATEMGKKRVDTLLHELAETGYHPNIISGLAYGIDITAHTACIHYGLKAQAVLGHGLHMVYPASHKNMAEKILEQGGALISEFPTCAQILPTNFLQRNRIVAGMSEAILVAESPIKGGAMSTARQALSYNREVMAIPGRPEDPTFAGCNLLIKQNIAALVENIKDLLRILNWPPLPTGPYQMSLDLFPITNNEVLLLEILLKRGEQNIDQLHQLTRIPVHDLSVLLLKLELEGHVMQLPGNCYTLI